jgi:hypothetical protein
VQPDQIPSFWISMLWSTLEALQYPMMLTDGPLLSKQDLDVVFQEVVHLVRTEEAEVAKLQCPTDQMNSYKNAPLTPKGREAMVRLVIDGGLSEGPPQRASSTPPRRQSPNGSSGSAQKVSMDCVIAPPDLFHCRAKQRLPLAQWSRRYAGSATRASRLPLRPVCRQRPSAAFCGGWD